MMACKVSMSPNPCLADLWVEIVPNRDLIRALTPWRSKVARATQCLLGDCDA